MATDVKGWPYRPLTEDERGLLNHHSRWGSDGWPIRKLKSKWIYEFRSIQAPTLYKTKREATEAYERFIEILLDLSGQESQTRCMRDWLARNGNDREALAKWMAYTLNVGPLPQVRVLVDEALARPVPA